jgi:hypothetical protein
VEYSGSLRSFVEFEQFKYKVIPRMRTRAMEHVYIYGSMSFTLGMLLLIGMILFTWIALRKIQCALVRRAINCKGITQTLIPNTSAVKPKVSQLTDGNLLWSVVYISDTVCLCTGTANDLLTH